MFYIENQESETLTAVFELQMENFMIQGGNVEDTEFSEATDVTGGYV